MTFWVIGRICDLQRYMNRCEHDPVFETFCRNTDLNSERFGLHESLRGLESILM